MKKAIICTSNHMFGRAIWNKLPDCIFENFEISNSEKCSKITRVTYLQNHPHQTCGYWLITPNQTETNILQICKQAITK